MEVNWDKVFVGILILAWAIIGGGAWYVNQKILGGETGSLFWWLTVIYELIVGFFFIVLIVSRVMNLTVVRLLGIIILLGALALFVFTILANISLDACGVSEEEVQGIVDPLWLRLLVYFWYGISIILMYGGWFLMKNSRIVAGINKYSHHWGKILFCLGILSMSGLVIGYSANYRCVSVQDQPDLQPSWISGMILFTAVLSLLFFIIQQQMMAFLMTLSGFLLMDGCQGKNPTYSNVYGMLIIVQGLFFVVSTIFGKKNIGNSNE